MLVADRSTTSRAGWSVETRTSSEIVQMDAKTLNQGLVPDCYGVIFFVSTTPSTILLNCHTLTVWIYSFSLLVSNPDQSTSNR